MRALLLLPLLAALSAAAGSAAPPPPPPPPPALLVLRAACPARDPTAFDSARLRRYAAAAARPAPLLPLRVLSYRETCGPGWPAAVARSALVALGGGAAVECIGWPGAATCSALSAAARALRQPQPAACAAPAARAAAVAALAARTRWTRALLPPAPPASECAASLREVARVLATAGLTVSSERLPPPEFADHPLVAIMCASFAKKWVEGAGATIGVTTTVLLLHIEELDVTGRSVLWHFDANDPRYRDASGEIDAIEKIWSTPGLNAWEDSPFKPPTKTMDVISTERESFGRVIDQDSMDQNYPRDRYRKSHDSGFIGVNLRIAPPIRSDVTIPGRVLLLENGFDENQTARDVNRVYDEILETLYRSTDGERSRRQTATMAFPLYGRTEERSRWRPVAVFETESTRSIDEAGEWVTTVKVVESNGALERWSATSGRSRSYGVSEGEGEGEGEGARTGGVALGASGAVVLAAGAALAARWAAVRRRRRRRRAGVVLAPADFTFPADERRRVGEGMETMLSCWLQQLHEFGGPELERPELLQRPDAAPRVPSAPSSTCSINRIPVDRRTRYKGDAVHMKYLPTTGALELKRKATDVLLVMQSLRHENVNPFMGCLCSVRPALVYEACGRGSLQDVLRADEIALDWTFRLSLLADAARGMRYLHASPLRAHGRLSSRNCVVDARWVLRLTDGGAPAFLRAQALPQPPRAHRELLWTAPELLRCSREEGVGGGAGGGAAGGGRATQPGDVFSFGIIMQEVIVRGEPYCMLALSPEEIVEKLARPPPLIRPSVSLGAAPPDAVRVMRQCWSEAPDMRPDFDQLHQVFRRLHRGRKINIVDSMFEMLEKYSNNLEELIKERTEQLDMEKKKTEQLLNRMLPRSVAERLMLGSRVEPEEFEEVSIYFSDIVGFTALAARSSAVQVVELLNELYTAFDAAIEQYRVYKVETIGDAYMVAGGLPARAADHAESVATVALHLLHLAGGLRARHLPDAPLLLRAGAHSGPCCAGVVGRTMPRYCLFGDTVNTASRMESTSAPWRIQLSAATAGRLAAAGGYRLQERGLVHVKGKGAMRTYWLLGKDGFDRPLPTPPPLQSEEEPPGAEGGDYEGEGAAPPPPPPPALRDRSPALDHQSPPTGQPAQASCVTSAGSGPPPSPPPPPPPLPPPPLRASASVDADHSAPYARYRWLLGAGGAGGAGGSGGAGGVGGAGGAGDAAGAPPLRQQWSLERGDALAALPARAPPRYRTRRDAHAADEEPHGA